MGYLVTRCARACVIEAAAYAQLKLVDDALVQLHVQCAAAAIRTAPLSLRRRCLPLWATATSGWMQCSVATATGRNSEAAVGCAHVPAGEHYAVGEHRRVLPRVTEGSREYAAAQRHSRQAMLGAVAHLEIAS